MGWGYGSKKGKAEFENGKAEFENSRIREFKNGAAEGERRSEGA
jgi:hypothetical protein